MYIIAIILRPFPGVPVINILCSHIGSCYPFYSHIFGGLKLYCICRWLLLSNNCEF
jgi:hypothetical protein